MSKKIRIEKDLLGEIVIPANVYWGINTQRALDNFQISDKRFPEIFLISLAQVKKACLLANEQLKLIDSNKAKAITEALDEIIFKEKFLDQFPIDVFQTGSGTQINMNMNEVTANRSNELLGYSLGRKEPVHPNDHVNMSQSSNDVIPTTMHLSAIELIQKELMPALSLLEKALKAKINEFKNIIKVGRTHLQDAIPIPLSMEFSVYKEQISKAIFRLKAALEELYYVPLGGTAVGTSLNAPKDFDRHTISYLSKHTHYSFKISPVKAEQISSHNTIVKVSSVLKLLALSLIKMANDIRWMGSGPRAGLGELILPQNEPGSSIMPGKINPTQSEALIQVCLQVIGYDTSITFAEGYSSLLDLNVAKPIMIVNLLESIHILSTGISSFIEKCLKGLKPNTKNIAENLQKTLMVVTKLTTLIGYEKAGEIAKYAYENGKSIKEAIIDLKIKIEDDLDELLDPKKMV